MGKYFGVQGGCVKTRYDLIEEEVTDSQLAVAHTRLSGTERVSLISLTTGDNTVLRNRWN